MELKDYIVELRGGRGANWLLPRHRRRIPLTETESKQNKLDQSLNSFPEPKQIHLSRSLTNSKSPLYKETREEKERSKHGEN